MLRIEGVNAHYGASHVLQGVDLDMPQGRISAVLGRNGVGKTTTQPSALSDQRLGQTDQPVIHGPTVLRA